MPPHITVPDLRFEESFKAKLIKNAIEENKRKGTTRDGEIDTHISMPLLIRTLLIDQIILPFVQSFMLAGFLYYLRPLIRVSALKGYRIGSSIVSFIKSTARSIFFIRPSSN